ncbi:UNVERIFIED_ORG: hypothetical protein FHR35_001925 [Microbispora rosea subsp. rosea]
MRNTSGLRPGRPLYPPGAEEALTCVIHRAFIDIRTMVWYRKPLRLDSDNPGPESTDYLQKIHMLSDLGDQLPSCLAAMLRRPRSPKDIAWNLTYTWRTASPEKRQWLRDTFAQVGYDHRHLFPDQGDYDKYDQATMLGKRIRTARTAAEAKLIAQGYDKEAWEEDRWHTLEEIPGPEGSRPHVIFTFSPRSRLARWWKSPLTIAVDVETNQATPLLTDPKSRRDHLTWP